jgi:hypothetical protein
MNKTFLILLIISLSGCVASRKGPPRFRENNPPVCPKIIESTAKNLEELGVDKTKVQKWKNETLSSKVHPCNVCQKMNEAIYIIRDDEGTYRAALKKLIQAVDEASDPNAASQTEQQTREIGSSMMDGLDKESVTLAGEYTNALEDLQTFLISRIHLPADETRNFILDKFYIPLIQQEEQTQ